MRAAICVALDRSWTPLSVRELVEAVAGFGIDLGKRPNKTISDAVRWEIGRNHVRRMGRGLFAVGSIPESTLRYMQIRVDLYVADPARSYSRPNYYPRVLDDGTILPSVRGSGPDSDPPPWPT